MRKSLFALAVALLAQAPAAAAQQTEVLAVVRQFIDGFNKGDVASAIAACAEQTSIIDEFPPHEWHGTGACAKWAADFDAFGKQNGITDPVVTLGTPKHNTVTGDVAYVVIPASYDYKEKGKPMKQAGSLLTVALRKGPAGWRITAWSWSTN